MTTIVTVLVEELSNHPVAQVREIESAMAAERRSIVEHGRAVDDLRAEHAASRRWWQLGKRFRQYREVRELRARTPKFDPDKPHQLAQRQAGVAAEDQVTFELGVLSDDWVLFRGYANRRGEVDHLLVGPGGVWAIEVKGRGIVVHVNGDDWRFDKFDRYGNLVEWGVLADRRGRSWGRQVTEVAQDLEKFLRSRRVAVDVQTAVVVSHDRAELGSCDDLLVSAVSIGTEYLLGRIRTESVVLDAHARAEVVGLVRRDHQFHVERRGRRRGTR